MFIPLLTSVKKKSEIWLNSLLLFAICTYLANMFTSDKPKEVNTGNKSYKISNPTGGGCLILEIFLRFTLILQIFHTRAAVESEMDVFSSHNHNRS